MLGADSSDRHTGKIIKDQRHVHHKGVMSKTTLGYVIAVRGAAAEGFDVPRLSGIKLFSRAEAFLQQLDVELIRAILLDRSRQYAASVRLGGGGMLLKSFLYRAFCLTDIHSIINVVSDEVYLSVHNGRHRFISYSLRCRGLFAFRGYLGVGMPFGLAFTDFAQFAYRHYCL